ncbi:hypothetical protein NEQG_01170 [Nematocida parisii ERTm3]|uniref:Uncharacterized protein n=1 Tax=Nematocida parisii (strain ERTm3) TaxID=935791 RepID=I3EGY3_NEMP3|nr:hypothetical protein NEQG_01170 [Nematocida parisii ERTm3]
MHNLLKIKYYLCLTLFNTLCIINRSIRVYYNLLLIDHKVISYAIGPILNTLCAISYNIAQHLLYYV